MATIYPSLLGIDMLNVQKVVEMVDPYVKGYQVDIMDNHFVPNLSYGADFVNALARITYKTVWVHLMVDNPDDMLDKFFLQPGSLITFHFEAETKIPRTITHIKDKKWHASIALNPKTGLEVIFPFLPLVHQVLVMSVDPGFPGQDFVPETFERVRTLAGLRETSGLDIRIGVDGGVKEDLIGPLIEAGVDDIAIASAIFDTPDPVGAVKSFAACAEAFSRRDVE